ncbi:MAG: DNA primase [Candidatus Atribacteria bacterium]|nr:DNA primase [Candidatus Atribacteria bacterium]
MRYSEEILDEIRNRLEIVELISEYVSLKPSGKGYKGLCPFHQEKTPSFMVDSERQIFHCFGCGEGGNIFTFIMKMEKVKFPEAVKILADKAGIALPTFENQNIKIAPDRELIFRLNEIAADYYHKNLFSAQGKSAQQYLLKRNFTKEVIKKFQLGYALPGYEHLMSILLAKKIPLSDLFKAGLVVKSSKSGKTMDYFRNRIIFPIFNLQGNIIAFGGRVLDDKLPKYINSPETAVYSKAKHLYGLFQAKKSIRQKNQVIIVEGYTDVLMAHQYGFENVVASLGTALTSQQIDLVKRYADEVLVAFDSDTAGKIATLRSLNMIKKAVRKVRIISLPLDSDPADVLLKEGKNYFSNLLDKALPLIDYKVKVLTEQYNASTSAGKISIIRELFPDLSSITSEVELQTEVKKIAEKLDLAEESILNDLNRYKKGNRVLLTSILTDTSSESTHINAEKILIGSMLQKRDNIEKIFSELQVEDFSVQEHREIVSIIMDLFKGGEKVSLQKVMDELEDPKMISLLSKIIMQDLVSLDTMVINRSIRAIKKYKLQQELAKIKNKIREEERVKKEVSSELLQNYQDVLHKIKAMI